MAPRLSFNMFQHLSIAIILLLCAITASAQTDHSFAINPNPSPEASTALICPTDSPADCYPALFQPTIHFQKIRPDQSLPPGLHVRLNIATGEKEARLNVPEEEDDSKEADFVLDDVPYTRQTEEQNFEKEELKTALQLRLQDEPEMEQHARPYTPPRPAAPTDPNEITTYEEALLVLKQDSTAKNGALEDLNWALETLTDLAHDLEWGLAISRDADLSRYLVDLIASPSDSLDKLCDPGLRPAALLLLGTAIQNNHDALLALLSHQYNDNYDAGEPLRATLTVLSHGSNHNCSPDPVLTSRAIFLLSQICVDDAVLSEFMSSAQSSKSEGLPQLLRLFLASLIPDQEDVAQKKITHRILNFVEDHSERVALILTNSGGGNEIGVRNLKAVLKPWCDALASAKQGYDGEFMNGMLETRRKVGNLLEKYTGKGCIGGVNLDALTEL